MLLGGAAAAAWPARGARAAVGDAGDRLSLQSVSGGVEGVPGGFRQGLKDTGFLEGDNVTIDYRWAENQPDRLPALVAELVRRRVTVIAAMDFLFGFACQVGIHDHPHRLRRRRRPCQAGLVTSLARPGGNLTGVNFFAAELTAKRLELLRELVPAAVRVAVLVNPDNAEITEPTLRDVEATARSMGLQIQIVNVRTSRETPRRLWRLLRASHPMCSSSAAAPFFNARRVQLALLAGRYAARLLFLLGVNTPRPAV